MLAVGVFLPDAKTFDVGVFLPEVLGVAPAEGKEVPSVAKPFVGEGGGVEVAFWERESGELDEEEDVGEVVV